MNAQVGAMGLRNRANPALGCARFRERVEIDQAVDNVAVEQYVLLVKTTIDLPEAMLHRAKVVAAQRKTTLRDLVVKGLQSELNQGVAHDREGALARLRKGFHLKGKALRREEIYER